MIDQETINCWRINYGLDKRTPEEAGRWWNNRLAGFAPAGAVAALGLCLDELERVYKLLGEAADKGTVTR